MKKMILMFCMMISISISCSTGWAAEPRSLNILMVAGGCCHDYEGQRDLLSEELSRRFDINWTVYFEADKSRDHEVTLFDDPDWHEDFDAVIYNICFADVKNDDYIESITRAHYESGTAAIALHCTMHTFRDAETQAWDRFIGLETSRHEHEQREYEIIALNREHPVMADFPEGNWKSPVDELYIVTNTYADMTPLAHSYGPETDAHHVVIWANTYGNARIVGITAGHNNEVMEDPVYLDLITNGLIWATD